MTNALVPHLYPDLHISLRAMASRYGQGLLRRSRALVSFLDLRMDLLIGGWIMLILLAGLAKVGTAAGVSDAGGEALVMLLPYLLIAFAPIAGYRVAAGSFPRGIMTAQPGIRLARYGKWQPLDVIAARSNPSFGPIGYMASLLVGILLNVPTRTLEYLAAVPAIGSAAPDWAQIYFAAMTADVIIMNFFYMVCFVMALRSVPLFPRMLLFAWVCDILMQLVIAHRLAGAPGLPPEVVEPMAALLHANIQKVLISALVWLPYLILSERVNVTYRQRTGAKRGA